MKSFSNDYANLNLNDVSNEFEDFLKILTVDSNDEQQSVIPEIKINDDINCGDALDLLDTPFVTPTIKTNTPTGDPIALNVTNTTPCQGYLSAPGSPSGEMYLSNELCAQSHSAPSSPLGSDGGETYSSKTNANNMMIEDPMSVYNNSQTYKYDPRPLGRKRRRNLVPQDKKTREYWERRQRNNVAARRSREERRIKELETYQKMKVLEKENASLKETINHCMRAQYDLQGEVQYLRQLLATQS